MSIPLYFATSFKAYKAGQNTHNAQLDFCFLKDGSLSVPKQIIPNAPIVIHDACLPERMPEDTTISHIVQLAKYGCFLDFERAPSKWSGAFLKELEIQLPADVMLAVPMAYASFVSRASLIVSAEEPVNNWTRFCKDQQQIYRKWVLEIIPYKKRVLKNAGKMNRQTLTEAVCLCRTDKNTIIYYDTMDTILSKLEIAEYFGCVAGIGLCNELEALKKQPESATYDRSRK